MKYILAMALLGVLLSCGEESPSTSDLPVVIDSLSNEDTISPETSPSAVQEGFTPLDAADLDHIEWGPLPLETNLDLDHPPYQLITTGPCHGNEGDLSWARQDWNALLLETDGYTGSYIIAQTKLEVTAIHDPCVDSEGEQSGFDVRHSSPGSCLFVLSESYPLTEGEVDFLPMPSMPLEAGQTFCFAQEGTPYQLMVTADRKEQDGNVTLSNCRLYFSRADGTPQTQLLCVLPFMDDATLQVDWIGDIDMDGKPDLFLSTSHKYSVYRPTLFLSGAAQGDELLGLVGAYRTTGC